MMIITTWVLLHVQAYLESLTSSQVNQHQLAVLLHWWPSSHDTAGPAAHGVASVQQRSRLKLEGHDAVTAGRVLVQPV